MANYIISYDLRGPGPTHHEIDQHMANVGWVRVRILETVWYVGADESTQAVFDHLRAIFSANDRLIIVNAGEVFWNILRIPDDKLRIAFASNAPEPLGTDQCAKS